MPFAIKQYEHPEMPEVTAYDVVEGQVGHFVILGRGVQRFVPADGGAVFHPLGSVAHDTAGEAWDKLWKFLMLRAGRLRQQLLYIDSLREVIQEALEKGTTP